MKIIDKENIYIGYRIKWEKHIEYIYSELNGGRAFGLIRRWLYGLVGDRLILLLMRSVDGEEVVIGISIYYINIRDVRENTVHEGFIGVLPQAEGEGIATRMRELAKQHFRRAGFRGISSRISKNNYASLRSAQKVGFVSVEEYIEEETGESRYYMVCAL